MPKTWAPARPEINSAESSSVSGANLREGAGDVVTEVPAIIHRIADQLSHRFAANFSSATVHRYVADTYFLLRDRARVTRFLASQTSRFATDRLSALASARGVALRPVPEVLFVCVLNGGRSQIAASVLKHLAGDRIHVRSAGSAPGDLIDPQVIELLDEVGVSVTGEYPKPLTDEIVQASDFVVTMGCGDACPVYPGRQYIDWAIEDPVGRSAEDVRRIRDDVWARVEALLPQLGIDSH
ncbi:arsenate-mycothiol transferase ArsC [Arthrobacter tecti]